MIANHWTLASVMFSLALVACVEPVSAGRDDILRKGQNEYEWNCKACHGAQGRGDGEMAAILIKPPSNLRTIKTRSGGNFPFWKVYEIISGREEVSGHNTFQMPKYWKRFRDDDGKPGFDTADFRLLALTHYIESMQDDKAID